MRVRAGELESVSRLGLSPLMKDAFTVETYRAAIQRAFAPLISEALLELIHAEYSPHHFGSFVVEFEGSCLRFQLVRDRLQFLASFAPRDTDDGWIDDETILNLVGAGQAADELAAQNLRSIEQLARTLHKHFASIRDLFSEGSVHETIRRANEYRRDRAERLFGYRPSTDGAPGGG